MDGGLQPAALPGLFAGPLVFAGVECHEHAGLEDAVFFDHGAVALEKDHGGLAGIVPENGPP